MNARVSRGLEFARMVERHWPEVRTIYGLGIATGHATFEPEPPATFEDLTAGKLAALCWVALVEGTVVGWVAAGAVSGRCVYSGVIEHSVYVHPRSAGQGVGLALLRKLIDSTEAMNIWTIESKIFPENEASKVLHHRAGFREVGVRERLGRMTFGPMAGRWRDAILVERRSTKVGN